MLLDLTGRLRKHSGTPQALAVAWLVAAIGYTIPAFLWHIEHFRSPGEQFYWIMLAILPMLAAMPFLYCRLRRRVKVYEPALLLAVPVSLGVFYEPLSTLAFAFIFLSIVSTGLWCMGRLGLHGPGLLNTIVMSVALGLGAFLPALMVLGYFGLLQIPVLAPLLIFPILISWRQVIGLPELFQRICRSWRDEPALDSTFSGLSISFLFALNLVATLAVLAPARTWDVTRLHLAAAQFYAKMEALRPLPKLSYSMNPQGVELLMALSYKLGQQPAAEMLVGLFFPAMLALGYLVARECAAGPDAALVGVTAAAATPVIHWSGCSSKNDLAMAFFLIASLYCYLRWLREKGFQWILAGAFMLAMSFHVKNIAIYGAAAIAIHHVHACWLQKQRWRSFSVVAMILLTGSAWMFRGYLLAGSPLGSVSGAKLVGDQVNGYSSNAITKLVEMARVLWEIHFRGGGLFEGLSPSENPMAVFLVLFGPLAFWSRRQDGKHARRASWIFVLVYYLLWATVIPFLRYAIAIIFLALLVVAAKVFPLVSRFAPWARGLVAGALCYSLVFGLLGSLNPTLSPPMLALFAGRIDKDRYLSIMLPEIPAILYVRDHAPPEDRVFGVESCAAAYLGHPGRFFCNSCARNSCTMEGLEAEISSWQSQWLILSTKPFYVPLADKLLAAGRATQTYSDAHFAVYRITTQRR